MKIKHIRSLLTEGGKAKAPEASQLDYGEIAVNYNDDDAALFVKTANNTVVRLDVNNIDFGALAFKGSVNVTTDVTPFLQNTFVVNDLYVNVEEGNFSATWAAITANADVSTVAQVGDFLAYDGNDWTHIPIGGTATDGVWVENSGNVFPADETNDVLVGGNTVLDAKAIITANGNATFDGSASFAGGIDTNSESTDGMQIDVSGGIAVQRSQGTGLAFTILNKKTNTLNIKADGSADFAEQKVNIYPNGVIRTGDNPANDGQFGTDISSDGPVRIRTSDTDAVRIYPDTGTDESITLASNGSASFAGGNMTISTVGNIIAGNDPSGGAGVGCMIRAAGTLRVCGGATSSNIQSYLSTSADPTFEVLGNGSASFAGNVTSGGNPNAGTAEGVKIRPDGIIQIAANASQDLVFAGYRVGTAEYTSYIRADGSASFAGGDVNINNSGEINSGNIDVSADSGKGGFKLLGSASAAASGRLEIQGNSGATGNFGAISIYKADQENIKLMLDGSATFNGGNLALQEIGDKSVISLRKDGDNLVHFGATDTQGVLGIDYRSASFQRFYWNRSN